MVLQPSPTIARHYELLINSQTVLTTLITSAIYLPVSQSQMNGQRKS